MVLFHHLGVNLRDHMCDVRTCVSASSLGVLDLAKNTPFLDW
jgi:hypothetical protein